MIPNGTSVKFIPQSSLILLVSQRLKTSVVLFLKGLLEHDPSFGHQSVTVSSQSLDSSALAQVAVSRWYLQTLQLCSIVSVAAASLGIGVSGSGSAQLSSRHKANWQGCAPRGELL